MYVQKQKPRAQAASPSHIYVTLGTATLELRTSVCKKYMRALRSRNSGYFATQITRITAPRKTAAAKTPNHQIDLYRSL